MPFLCCFAYNPFSRKSKQRYLRRLNQTSTPAPRPRTTASSARMTQSMSRTTAPTTASPVRMTESMPRTTASPTASSARTRQSMPRSLRTASAPSPGPVNRGQGPNPNHVKKHLDLVNNPQNDLPPRATRPPMEPRPEIVFYERQSRDLPKRRQYGPFPPLPGTAPPPPENTPVAPYGPRRPTNKRFSPNHDQNYQYGWLHAPNSSSEINLGSPLIPAPKDLVAPPGPRRILRSTMRS